MILFRLLRIGLETEAVVGDTVGLDSFNGHLSDCDWNEIYSLGVSQGVAALMLDGLQALVDVHDELKLKGPDKKLKMAWLAHTMKVERSCDGQYRLASEIAQIYNLNGIRTVVLKGIAAGLNYPRPRHRPCGDLDCYLMGKYEEGNKVAESAGADVKRNYYKHSHINYRGLEIENHQFCTGIRGNRRTKAFERLLQSLLNDEGTSLIGNTKLECPSPMFNALFLTHHSQRHYLSEGIALRHLCDWAMFLKVHGDKVDWPRFRQIAKEYGFEAFADTMTRLSNRYLHVAVPAEYLLDRNDELDSYLLDDMLSWHKSHGAAANKFMLRVRMARSVFENNRRYKLFYDTSMMRYLSTLVCGFLFDRNPRL